MTLHGYFRSSAAWRVRIALGLKGLSLKTIAHNLRTGEQNDPAYAAINPQKLVPTLEFDDGTVLTQSLAIIGWLDREVPKPPLLPPASRRRAQVEAFALTIACDTHPLQNLKVLNRLRAAGWAEDQVKGWIAAALSDGLSACEALLRDEGGPFCFGEAPGLADLCLVPQIGSARRFGVDLSPYPKLVAIDATCAAHPAFIAARPDQQPDAV
ncbi:maleylpyruvate isomerase [Bosea sp. OK403]|uniref:maleylacetoacetate isomerase n=1 Tax=Bosea sp. OK403 TaxID=1855286 RepID=UPI0008DF83C0|nr:maleylacetoacetate isomerase [Bosea sp. OK403]SFJ92355.1 maleylpyruvate isomerase [Bosea sp. OK403]